jgi:hypothetical protein
VGCGCDQDIAKASVPKSTLCRIWHVLTHEPKTPFGDPCIVVPGHVIRKPDPCIYDQFLLMQLQQPVTWDNPDVRILLNGVEQPTYNLTVATDYDVEITVHNSSRDKPANNTSVDIRWVEFGAGGETRHPISTLTADVPIWPGTALVTTTWRTPDTPGHYCIEVELSHPDDGNPANNVGWNNTQVFAAQSPVERKVRIFNRYPGACPPIKEGGGPWVRPHRVFAGWALLGATGAPLLQDQISDNLPTVLAVLTLVGLGYVGMAALGLAAEWGFAWIKRRNREQRGVNPRRDRHDCHLVQVALDSYTYEDGSGKEFDPDGVYRPQPALWGATVEPSSFVFAPDEAFRDVALQVAAPDTPGQIAYFNLNVRQGGVPTGGVTIAITTGG